MTHKPTTDAAATSPDRECGHPNHGAGERISRESAEKFIKAGWAPTMVQVGNGPIQSGVAAL